MMTFTAAQVHAHKKAFRDACREGPVVLLWKDLGSRVMFKRVIMDTECMSYDEYTRICDDAKKAPIEKRPIFASSRSQKPARASDIKAPELQDALDKQTEGGADGE